MCIIWKGCNEWRGLPSGGKGGARGWDVRSASDGHVVMVAGGGGGGDDDVVSISVGGHVRCLE